MPPKAADPAANGEPLRVLVIDDDRSHAETVAEVLERVGYDCTVVTSGRAGVQALGRDDYDVVLTDLRMNDLDGLAVVRAAKAEQPDADVVVITGHGDVQTAVEAIKQGAAHYLLKPVDLGELRAIVGKVLIGRYVGLEAGASKIYSFEAQAIPGLLQLPDYTRLLIRAARPDLRLRPTPERGVRASSRSDPRARGRARSQRPRRATRAPPPATRGRATPPARTEERSGTQMGWVRGEAGRARVRPPRGRPARPTNSCRSSSHHPDERGRPRPGCRAHKRYRNCFLLPSRSARSR